MPRIEIGKLLEGGIPKAAAARPAVANPELPLLPYMPPAMPILPPPILPYQGIPPILPIFMPDIAAITAQILAGRRPRKRARRPN